MGSGRGISQVLCSAFRMDHLHFGRCPLCETINIHKALRRPQDFIIDNKPWIFSITGRMHSQEEQRNVFILETLHNQKSQIESLQAECVTLQQMILNLAKSPTLVAFNARLSIRSRKMRLYNSSGTMWTDGRRTEISGHHREPRGSLWPPYLYLVLVFNILQILFNLRCFFIEFIQ
jgi:hypothetical protein